MTKYCVKPKKGRVISVVAAIMTVISGIRRFSTDRTNNSVEISLSPAEAAKLVKEGFSLETREN